MIPPSITEPRTCVQFLSHQNVSMSNSALIPCVIE